MSNPERQAAANKTRTFGVWVVLLAAAGTFALTMGTRQSMGLFLSSLNTTTGLGVGSISLGAWAAEGVQAKIGPSEDSF